MSKINNKMRLDKSMKKIILSLTLVSTLAQELSSSTIAILNTAPITINDERLKLPDQERIVKIDGKIYQVKYVNISVGFWTPATYPSGQSHHGCKCLVIFSDDNLLIGELPNAVWTPKGCFEDNPQQIAEQVLENLRNNL